MDATSIVRCVDSSSYQIILLPSMSFDSLGKSKLIYMTNVHSTMKCIYVFIQHEHDLKHSFGTEFQMFLFLLPKSKIH